MKEQKHIFAVGDSVIFEHPDMHGGVPIPGVITEIDFKYRHPILVTLDNEDETPSFTIDGRFSIDKEPSLRPAEKPLSPTRAWDSDLDYYRGRKR